jgi:molybdopterin converting factor subunit 1
MKTVIVQYFALLREQAGCSEERVRTTAANPVELFAELQTRRGFSLGRDILKVAVNDDFASWDAALCDGDRVVFIPPVAGG